MWDELRGFFLLFAREQFARIISVYLLILLAGSSLAFIFEHAADPARFRNLWDAVYFVFISMTTVGYGDYTPSTTAGRVIIMLMVAVNVVFVSFISATIASILVARKLKEGMGLEKINLRNHLIVCGWNLNAHSILQHLSQLSALEDKELPTVLVNSLPEEETTDIIATYPRLEIKWVSGDHTHEVVLDRAAARTARAAIILADYSLHAPDKSDERAILTTLALKSLNPDIIVSAQVFNESTRAHLKRARADDVIVAGDQDGFFLLASSLAPGLNRMVQEILGPGGAHEVWVRPIPRSFVGKSFGELMQYWFSENGDILLGVIGFEPGITLSEVLSDDYTVIDRFIESKFKKAKLGGIGRKGGYFPRLNPGADYTIAERDLAVCLTTVKKEG
ncbi:MAG: hypothetical protein B1H03_02415 [Planctomycetales bacterium 4484_113]|nr:MAG: hypothetical protein B1H03_02415 [Planctomycetales bacterium 4484_113]